VTYTDNKGAYDLTFMNVNLLKGPKFILVLT